MNLFVLKGDIMVRHCKRPIPIQPDKFFLPELVFKCLNVLTDQVFFLLNCQNCHASPHRGNMGKYKASRELWLRSSKNSPSNFPEEPCQSPQMGNTEKCLLSRAGLILEKSFYFK